MEPRAFLERIDAGRVVLRKHQVEQAEEMFSVVDGDRERLRRFLPWVDSLRGVEDERKYLEMTDREWAKSSLFDFGMHRRDGAYLGNIGVHSIAWPHGRCELGYWIAGQFEGQGYVTEAVAALEKACFELGFFRVEIRCSSLNERSAAVPKRLGYRHEGTLRQEAVDHRGQRRDTFIFAKLRGE